MSDRSSMLCRGKKFTVSGADIDDGVATANWLLDHGARVTITGAHRTAEMQKRVHDHIKRTARDGDAYKKTLARLSWSTTDAPTTSDVRSLFLSAWKRNIIGVTGAYGKTTTAVWAAHLIGDAVVAGHMPGKPLLPALDSRARTAVVVLDRASATPHMTMVSTDGTTNLDAAMRAARSAGVSEELIRQRAQTLPEVPLRQEVVYRSPKLTVVNDAMATHPVHGVAALRRWGGPTCVLICGGDDVRGNYDAWADELLQRVRRTNIVFLTGSATKKMRASLGADGRGIRAYDSLESAFKIARARAALYVSSVILFSPAALVGEMFSDTYDRGRRLNTLVERI